MAAVLFILAQTEGPGRGSNADPVSGILIIVGIIALVALVGFLVLRFLVPKLRGNRALSPNEDETHDPGRTGRIL